MEESNQEMNDGQPGLEEVPDVNNNQGPEYTGHMEMCIRDSLYTDLYWRKT